MISTYKRVNENTLKRIVVLSDGEDTTSKNSLQKVTIALQRHNIKLDVLILGESALTNISSYPGDCFLLNSNKVFFSFHFFIVF